MSGFPGTDERASRSSAALDSCFLGRRIKSESIMGVRGLANMRNTSKFIAFVSLAGVFAFKLCACQQAAGFAEGESLNPSRPC
jgi:hypothetical protein